LGQSLCEAMHRFDIGRRGQKFQFIEKLFGLTRLLMISDDGN
jgi:hypothetical protein